MPQPAVCVLCAAIADARARRVRSLIVGGALTLVIAGGAGFLLSRPSHPTPLHAAAAGSADDPVEQLQRGRLAKNPCDAETSLALIENLMQHERWRDAKTFALGSIQTCGVIGRMKWYLAHCDHELHDYADEEKVTGELIAADPTDSDYWWWQGEALAYANKHEQALAAYRQSLALSSGTQAAQFAAHRIGDPAAALKRGCEADRAWRWYASLGGRIDQEMHDNLSANTREKTCAAELGTGRALLRDQAEVTLVADDAPKSRGVAATMVVDAELGTTLLSRAFAAKAGITPEDSSVVQATSHGKLYTGTPVRVTLRAGGARARGVEAMVTDDLMGDDAGVLGLSFLWHFDVGEPVDGGHALAPPQP